MSDTTTISISKDVLADFQVAFAQHRRHTGQRLTQKEQIEFILRRWSMDPVFESELQTNGDQQ